VATDIHVINCSSGLIVAEEPVGAEVRSMAVTAANVLMDNVARGIVATNVALNSSGCSTSCVRATGSRSIHVRNSSFVGSGIGLDIAGEPFDVEVASCYFEGLATAMNVFSRVDYTSFIARDNVFFGVSAAVSRRGGAEGTVQFDDNSILQRRGLCWSKWTSTLDNATPGVEPTMCPSRKTVLRTATQRRH